MNLTVSQPLALEKLFWDRLGAYFSSPTKRYGELLLEVRERKAKVILEIGVYSGQRAREMIETAKIAHDAEDIWYLGFDLFEMFEPEILDKEFSKVPKSESEILELLEPTGANIRLFKGYSQDTLKEFMAVRHLFPPVDFFFIDGGHAVDTIRSDWGYVRQMMTLESVVVFDDYYHGSHAQNREFGADDVLAEIDGSLFDAECLRVRDRFQKDFGVLDISLARVLPAAKPSAADQRAAT